MHSVTLESVAALTDHFADAFLCKNVTRIYKTLWRCNAIQKFDAGAIFWGGIKYVKMDI